MSNGKPFWVVNMSLLKLVGPTSHLAEDDENGGVPQPICVVDWLGSVNWLEGLSAGRR